MSSSSSSSSLAECSNDGGAGNQAAVVIDAGDANNDANNDANHGANGGSSSSSSSSSTSSGEIRRRARRRARRKAKAKAKRARRSPDRHHETNPVGYDRRKTGTHRKTGGRRRHGEGGSDLSSSTSATTGGAGMRRQRSYTDDRESYDGDAALRHGIDRRRGKASSHLPVLELLRRARESEDRTLSITGRRLTPDDVDALAAALARGTPNPIDDIEVLILSRTRLRADGCVALARALEVNTTVHTVSFFRNRIGADGAEALARLLDVNTTITTLNCGVNRIGAIGAEAIARALAGNTTLKVLELAVNKIGSLSHNVDAVAAMAEAIKHNCTLETLNLFRNGLGKRGTVLAEALAENRGSALRVLDLGACHLGTSFGRALGATLRTNRTLETISVPQNHLGEAGGAALAEALQENISVTRLDCRKNHIGAENTKSIAAALSVNVLEKAALRRSAELFATVDEICVNSLVPGGTEADVPGALVQYVDTLARLPVELRLFCARTPVRRKEPSDALIASFQRRVSLVMSDRQRDWYNAWAICVLSVRVAEKVHGTLDGIPQRSPEGSRVRALLQAVHSRLTLLFIGTAFDGYIDAGARRTVATAIAAKAQAGGPAALTHPVLYGMVDAAAAKPRRAQRETSNHVASVKKALAASASLSCDAAEDGTITWTLRPAPPTAHPPPLSYA